MSAKETKNVVASVLARLRNALKKKIGEDGSADAFGRVVADLKNFAMPVLRSISHDDRFARNWKAGRGWAGS